MTCNVAYGMPIEAWCACGHIAAVHTRLTDGGRFTCPICEITRTVELLTQPRAFLKDPK